MEQQQAIQKPALLQRWKEIEEIEDNGSFKAAKQGWFEDAFSFINHLPTTSHSWCQHEELTVNLLEPFFYFFKEGNNPDSRIKVLWRRFTSEFQVCVKCISSYYQTKECFKREYDEGIAKSVLTVLFTIDCLRVVESMEAARQPGSSINEMCIMFEIFMHPELLEDPGVDAALVPFFQHVAENCELHLSPIQRYPGLYGLLFHSSKDVRKLVLELARSLPPFSDAEDLEVVQPVLEKRMKLLKAGQKIDHFSFTQESLWLGMKTMLQCLKAPAIEEGIVERYPSFVGIVLNHISELSTIFWNALSCLETLLKTLGYSLWLQLPYSPGVLRNTLVSQCFHAKEERTHKYVFNTFECFLESLEPMQVEYERQRRMLLYFLLIQVSTSSNFRTLIRKYVAPQTAFNILLRSYKMDPVSPPLECVHFLGPTLISVLKDTTLEASVRQPALELAGTILVADATAMAELHHRETEGAESTNSSSSGWSSFTQRMKRDCDNWYCVPLLWIEALQCPSLVQSTSFIEAFVWAVSRVSVFDWETGDEALNPDALKWEQPQSNDDGGDGRVCKNAVRASENLEPLVSLFKRSADPFASRVWEEARLAERTWGLGLTEPLLLLMMDSNKVLNMLGKEILLNQFSKDKRFDSVVRFICENEESLLCAVRSFRHAVKLIGSGPWKHCGSLQQVLFIASRFYTFAETSGQEYGKLWRRFSQKVSPILWGLLQQCVVSAKDYAGVLVYEAVCIRMFELLPKVFKNLILSTGNDWGKVNELWKVEVYEDCPRWFEALVKWSGTVDHDAVSAKIILRRWNSAVVSILEDLARGVVSSKAGASKIVSDLLRPGSVIDNDDRDRLSILFSSSTSAAAVRVPEPVIEIDSDDDEAPAAGEQLQRKIEGEQLQRKIEGEQLQKRKDEQQLQLQRKIEGEQLQKRKDDQQLQLQRKKEDVIIIEPPKQKPQHKRPVRFERQQTLSFAREREPAEVIPIARAEPPRKDIPLPEKAPPTPEQQTPEEPLRQDAQERDVRTAEELYELVREDEPENVDAANARKQRAVVPVAAIPKRKLMRLDMTDEVVRPSILLRNRGRPQRPPPPKMDDWLMRILCLDLFDDSERCSPELSAVPTSFQSSEHYIEVFRPLLLEEFKAQLRRSHEELDPKDEEVAGVVSLMSLERVDSLHLAKLHSEAGRDRAARACMENDLVLLSKQPFLQISGGVHLLAKVDRREHQSGMTIVSMKLYLPPADARLSKAKNLLVNRSKWHLTRLLSMTPQMREFQAMSAMTSSPFLDIVLSASSSCAAHAPAIIPDPLFQRLSSDYDSSQLKAIKAALGDRRGGHQMSLVQGPPGTGKTRTIVAIISALMCGTRCNDAPRSDDPKPSRARSVCQSVALARAWQQSALAKQMARYEEDDRGHQQQPGRKSRILVCAQSNAAVDELVARLLKDGIYSSSGEFYTPEIVRAGKASSVHRDSMPVFVDTIVERKLAAERGNEGESGGEDTATLQKKLEQVTEEINQAACRLAAGESEAELGPRKRVLEKKKHALTMELSKAMKKTRASFEADRAKKRLLRKETFRDAEIVLTTLSGCGGDVYSACTESSEKGADVFFDAVVIDEAAQALEPATLIPLQLVSFTQGRCVMVGDPKQLPATVLSQAANRMSFERSMFERFQSNGFPVTMLSIQYRMHPEIRRFPSLYFYDNQLRDGEAVLGSRRQASFHKDKMFPPYVFLDVSQGQETSGQSISNPEEARVAVALYKSFKLRYSGEPWRVGVITPYKQQQTLLRNHFREAFGEKIFDRVEFNTIDGFQGREVDIVILSTVRAQQESNKRSIGFVADIRRMNVALTRARFSLWIVGNERSLKANQAWKALLEDSRSRQAVVVVEKPYSSFFNPGRSSREQGDGEVSRKRPGEAIENGSKRPRTESDRTGFRSQSQVSDRVASGSAQGRGARGVDRNGLQQSRSNVEPRGFKAPERPGGTRYLNQPESRGFKAPERPESRGTKPLNQPESRGVQPPESRGTKLLDQQSRGSVPRPESGGVQNTKPNLPVALKPDSRGGGAPRPESRGTKPLDERHHRASQARNNGASTSEETRPNGSSRASERDVVRNSDASRGADDDRRVQKSGIGLQQQQRKKKYDVAEFGFLLDSKKDFVPRKRPAGVPPRKPG